MINQLVVGFTGVLWIFLFAAAFRVAFGFDPPLGEVTIGAIVTITVGRLGASAYTYTEIQKTNVKETGNAVPMSEMPIPPGVPQPKGTK